MITKSVTHDPLSEKIKYTFVNNDLDYILNNLALVTMQQKGILITIEAELPPDSEHFISLSADADMTIGEWLKLLKSQDTSLCWTTDGDTIHVLLPNGHDFENPLDRTINFNYSGSKTLEEWQGLVQKEYPNFNFVFNGNGLRMMSDDVSNEEYRTRKFFCSVFKGMTLRQYYSKIAQCYGDSIWIIEFADPKIISPPDVVPSPKVTWVSFRTIHKRV